tara:strand:- start:3009 stop:3575 length:567 start_codon:yes stop_codon:yes gene_type:complete
MEKDNKQYAIVLELSDSMLKEAKTAMTILSNKFEVSYLQSLSQCPHITLVSGLTIFDTIQFWDSLCFDIKQVEKFGLKGNGLGIFVRDTPVIHIRWQLNRSLKHLRDHISTVLYDMKKKEIILNYEKDLDWLPKTTLAFHDTSYESLSEVIKSIKDLNFLEIMQVGSLSLYEYSSLKGEKCLYNYFFE